MHLMPAVSVLSRIHVHKQIKGLPFVHFLIHGDLYTLDNEEVNKLFSLFQFSLVCTFLKCIYLKRLPCIFKCLVDSIFLMWKVV